MILKFCHLLERHELGARLFEQVGAHLQAQGCRLSTGAIVDATLIAAPSYTKNVGQSRDPEIHQSKKGNQWYFGMKAHVAVDAKSKLIHRVVATSGNVHDSKVLSSLLHGKESVVWGDSAYASQSEVIERAAPWAQDLTQRRGKGCKYLSQMQRTINRSRSKVRARVDHAIGTIKRIFNFTKVRYQGLAKNGNRLFVAAALANLYMVAQAIAGIATSVVSQECTGRPRKRRLARQFNMKTRPFIENPSARPLNGA